MSIRPFLLYITPILVGIAFFLSTGKSELYQYQHEHQHEHQHQPHSHRKTHTSWKNDDISRVIVPAVYKEWVSSGPPEWVTNQTLHKEYKYHVFSYQKLNESEPNFISTNQGTESGVYLRFIVDHYDSLPDIVLFIHGNPFDHFPKLSSLQLAQLIASIRPNATYLNIGSALNGWQGCRDTTFWHKTSNTEIWTEQCIRDVLSLYYNVSSTELAAKYHPNNRPIRFCFACCNHFFMTKKMIQSKSFAFWNNLHEKIAVQPVCHDGEPEYDMLYAYQRGGVKVGPEPHSMTLGGFFRGQVKDNGYITQGIAMEHLSHVVFGNEPIESKIPKTMEEICTQFFPNLPGSPCRI